jgi:hypothetical protein
MSKTPVKPRLRKPISKIVAAEWATRTPEDLTMMEAAAFWKENPNATSAEVFDHIRAVFPVPKADDDPTKRPGPEADDQLIEQSIMVVHNERQYNEVQPTVTPETIDKIRAAAVACVRPYMRHVGYRSLEIPDPEQRQSWLIRQKNNPEQFRDYGVAHCELHSHLSKLFPGVDEVRFDNALSISADAGELIYEAPPKPTPTGGTIPGRYDIEGTWTLAPAKTDTAEAGTLPTRDADCASSERAPKPHTDQPEIPQRAIKAWDGYTKACEALKDTNSHPTDRAAYDLLVKVLARDDEGEELPRFDSWQRNLREYRQKTGQQKRKPRRDHRQSSGLMVHVNELDYRELPTRIKPADLGE